MTKADRPKQPAENVAAILRACAAVGGQASMARLLDVTPSAVNQWCSGDRPVPAKSCPTIEQISGVRCEDLQPDVKWGVLRQQLRRVTDKAPRIKAEG